MLDVFLRSGKREHEAEDQKKGNVEAGADHHAHVERAAAAAAFDVRWHAHLWYLCVPQAQMLIDVLPLRAVARARAAVTAARRQLQGDLCWVLIDGAARWRSLTIQVRQVCTQRKDAVVYISTGGKHRTPRLATQKYYPLYTVRLEFRPGIPTPAEPLFKRLTL